MSARISLSTVSDFILQPNSAFRINNVEDQLDAIIDIPISSTCFGECFTHPQERKTVFYSSWYNAPKLLPAGGLERGGTDIVCAVKHRLALLRMGKTPETC